ncbi:hypothetical protein AGMMS49975_28440 [Clostridia bacterium]|nr:hypothetical protein AGMMS49975_28440 [Clostridia bacterium]
MQTIYIESSLSTDAYEIAKDMFMYGKEEDNKKSLKLLFDLANEKITGTNNNLKLANDKIEVSGNNVRQLFGDLVGNTFSTFKAVPLLNSNDGGIDSTFFYNGGMYYGEAINGEPKVWCMDFQGQG